MLTSMYRVLYICLFILFQLSEGSNITSQSFVTSSCNFILNNNLYDLSPLTLTDGRSYKTSNSLLKFDYIFNICGYATECKNKYSTRRDSQACSLFPLPVQIGDTNTEIAVENPNGITLSYTGSDFLCSRSNDLVFTCDESTDITVVGAQAHRCKYTVNIRSKYACPIKPTPKPTLSPQPKPPRPKPSNCVFQGSSENTFFDFTKLKNITYQANVGYIDSGYYTYYTLFFSICGEISVCTKYNQQNPDVYYQSCQVYLNQNQSIQTGDPSIVQDTLIRNGIRLNYQATEIYSGCLRNINLILSCDKDEEFTIGQAKEISPCAYEIPIVSLYACPFSYDSSSSSSSSGGGSPYSSSSSSSETPTSTCIIDSNITESPYGFNLSALSGSNHPYYIAKYQNDLYGDFNLLFSVCQGKVDKCQQYNQLSGNSTSYQSCQVYNDKYSIQTGTPSLLSYETSPTGISLLYKSNMYSNSIAKQNKLNLVCNSTTDFDIESTSIQKSILQVNINSRYACPSQCVFRDNSTGKSIDLSPLILPNNGAYEAKFQSYSLYFTFCGQIDICLKYEQQIPGMGPYQSCQLLMGVKPPLAVQTGKSTSLQVTVSTYATKLNYTSDSFPCGSGHYRYNILNLACDPTTDYKIISTNESPFCNYEINISTKYACPR
ncbi:hypothetical protein CYY_005924 [Polysphondylium violaceum]|uniref:MRH domain-containing protein n=1 Tax=Polysphondylium violaceum TaxID=133409 RepID=A0A8J4PS43_9MYCE|nr:hypothetical protein CYY_005924 [Polysphondylium violaceum]